MDLFAFLLEWHLHQSEYPFTIDRIGCSATIGIPVQHPSNYPPDSRNYAASISGMFGEHPNPRMLSAPQSRAHLELVLPDARQPCWTEISLGVHTLFGNLNARGEAQLAS